MVNFSPENFDVGYYTNPTPATRLIEVSRGVVTLKLLEEVDGGFKLRAEVYAPKTLLSSTQPGAYAEAPWGAIRSGGATAVEALAIAAVVNLHKQREETNKRLAVKLPTNLIDPIEAGKEAKDLYKRLMEEVNKL